jgi:hypothetical protein
LEDPLKPVAFGAQERPKRRVLKPGRRPQLRQELLHQMQPANRRLSERFPQPVTPEPAERDVGALLARPPNLLHPIAGPGQRTNCVPAEPKAKRRGGLSGRRRPRKGVVENHQEMLAQAERVAQKVGTVAASAHRIDALQQRAIRSRL